MMRRVSSRRVVFLLLIFLSLYLLSTRLIPRLIPWPGEQALSKTNYSLHLLDRNGRDIQILPVNSDGLRRMYVPYSRIPQPLLKIVRKSEDRRFFLHPGVDLLAVTRAAIQYQQKGRVVSGGSTISMQLARIILPRDLNRRRSVGSAVAIKLREVWQAFQIESRYSKKEIIEMYINLVPFGRNIQGYPAAARYFFNKELSELNSSDICRLALIPRSPTLYNPFLSPENSLAASTKLAQKVLPASQRPADIREFESQSQLSKNPGNWPFEAPHFTRHLVARRDSWSELQKRGFIPVSTTLDLEIQHSVEQRLARAVRNAQNFRISNGAVLIADPKSAELLAYVGSADFNNKKNSGQIDGAAMHREPGSTLKPLLYASLLDKGWTAATIIPDIPADFGGEYVYKPENYNEQYHGPVRLRRALAASLNIPAVYALERLGVNTFTEILTKAGFKSLEQQKDSLGVSLAVGGAEINLKELLQAYLSLYSGGIFRELRMIRTGTPNEMKSSTQYPTQKNQTPVETRVWLAESADIITDILSTVDDRVSTFGRSGPVRFDYPVAIKTGTSNQFNNIWAVGFASDIAGAVWMGNFDGSTVMAAPGSSIPAELLHELFDSLSERATLPKHSELETTRICSLSGMAATNNCNYTIEELFAPGTTPSPCFWHSDTNGDPRTETLYPQEYEYWASIYGYNLRFSKSAKLDFLHPSEGSVFFMNANPNQKHQSLKIRISGSGNAVLKANGRPLYDGPLPAEVSWPMERGRIRLTLDQDRFSVTRHIEIQ